MKKPLLSLVLMTASCFPLCSAVALAQLSPAPTIERTRPRQLPLSGSTQSGSVTTGQATVPSASSESVSTLNSSIQIQGAFQGSTPSGVVSSEPLSLALDEVIRRGL